MRLRHIPSAAALLSILVAWSTSTQGATYYVNNRTGSDAFNGTAAQPGPKGAGPFATIQTANALLAAGDTLSLANTGKPYRESIHFHGLRGTPAKPIVIEGNGATITGLRTLTEWIKQDDGSYLCPLKGRPYGCPYLMVDGKRQPAAARKGSPTFGRCLWDSAGVHFMPEPGKTPADYAIEATVLVSGVLVSSSSYVVVRDLISERFSNDGYNIHGECRGWLCENIVGRYNGDDGFSIHETVGAVVRNGHFHDNSFGVQDVNASRTILNGVTVERNKVGFSMVGGFRSMVDCVSRDNTNAAISLSGNNPRHLLGSEHNPLAGITAYMKNVYAVGGANALEMRGRARAMAEHCVFGYADVGVRLDDKSHLHLTGSIVAHCKNWEILSRSPNLYREANIYFPGKLYWLTQGYTGETFDAFREAAGHDTLSLVADPKLIEGTPQVADDSPARQPMVMKSDRYNIRVIPRFLATDPTPSVEAVWGSEAESLALAGASVVEDPVASAGKAVELAGEGAAVSATVRLEPGSYALLATCCSSRYGRASLLAVAAQRTLTINCQPFTYYAPRCPFEVTAAGEYNVTITWQAGPVRLDRVAVVRVLPEP